MTFVGLRRRTENGETGQSQFLLTRLQNFQNALVGVLKGVTTARYNKRRASRAERFPLEPGSFARHPLRVSGGCALVCGHAQSISGQR